MMATKGTAHKKAFGWSWTTQCIWMNERTNKSSWKFHFIFLCSVEFPWQTEMNETMPIFVWRQIYLHWVYFSTYWFLSDKKLAETEYGEWQGVTLHALNSIASKITYVASEGARERKWKRENMAKMQYTMLMEKGVRDKVSWTFGVLLLFVLLLLVLLKKMKSSEDSPYIEDVFPNKTRQKKQAQDTYLTEATYCIFSATVIYHFKSIHVPAVEKSARFFFLLLVFMVNVGCNVDKYHNL